MNDIKFRIRQIIKNEAEVKRIFQQRIFTFYKEYDFIYLFSKNIEFFYDFHNYMVTGHKHYLNGCLFDEYEKINESTKQNINEEFYEGFYRE